MSHETTDSQEDQTNSQTAESLSLPSEQLGRLDTLRELLGEDVAAQTLEALKREKKTDRDIESILAALRPLVAQGELEIPSEGYLVRRGSHGLVVESMKTVLRLWIKEPSAEFLADFAAGLAPLPKFSEEDFKRRIIDLPRSYSSKRNMSQIKPQGNGPMCTSFAVVACLGYVQQVCNIVGRSTFSFLGKEIWRL